MRQTESEPRFDWALSYRLVKGKGNIEIVHINKSKAQNSNIV